MLRCIKDDGSNKVFEYYNKEDVVVPSSLFKFSTLEYSFLGECREDLEQYVALGVDLIGCDNRSLSQLSCVNSFEQFRLLVDLCCESLEQLQHVYLYMIVCHSFFRCKPQDAYKCCNYILDQHERWPGFETKFDFSLNYLYRDMFELFKLVLTRVQYDERLWNYIFVSIVYTTHIASSKRDPLKETLVNQIWMMQSDHPIQPLETGQLNQLDSYHIFCNSPWLRMHLYHHPELERYPNLLYAVNVDQVYVQSMFEKLHKVTGLPLPLIRYYVLPSLF